MGAEWQVNTKRYCDNKATAAIVSRTLTGLKVVYPRLAAPPLQIIPIIMAGM